MEKKYAVLVVDMLNDFVTGALKCDRGIIFEIVIFVKSSI